jgi:hypothetical protein
MEMVVMTRWLRTGQVEFGCRTGKKLSGGIVIVTLKFLTKPSFTHKIALFRDRHDGEAGHHPDACHG